MLRTVDLAGAPGGDGAAIIVGESERRRIRMERTSDAVSGAPRTSGRTQRTLTGASFGGP